MPIALEDVVEAAATGVLRALDARRRGGTKGTAEAADSTLEMIRAGFYVSIAIRCGGLNGRGEEVALNPQPLPPRFSKPPR